MTKQESKRGKSETAGSPLDQVHFDINENDVQIRMDQEILESIAIDDLNEHSINDISRNLVDRLNLSLDSQFQVQSRLESFLRLKEALSGLEDHTLNHKIEDSTKHGEYSRVLDSSRSSCDDDELIEHMKNFRKVYKEQYLIDMKDWMIETLQMMDLRHEAEINELRRLHTEQKQIWLDEMKSRRHRAKDINQKMRITYRKGVEKQAFESENQESKNAKQTRSESNEEVEEEEDSNSYQSQEFSFRESSVCGQESSINLNDPVSTVYTGNLHDVGNTESSNRTPKVLVNTRTAKSRPKLNTMQTTDPKINKSQLHIPINSSTLGILRHDDQPKVTSARYKNEIA